MDDASFITILRDFGPITALFLVALPYMLKQGMGTADTYIKGRLELASQPFEMLKTSLSNERENRDKIERLADKIERLTEEFIGLRSTINTMHDDVKSIIQLIQGHKP